MRSRKKKKKLENENENEKWPRGTSSPARNGGWI